MHALTLPGLRPTVLGDYLAALGLFRATHRLLDANVLASWHDGRFVLHCAYSTVDELVTALIAGYTPEPVVSPWNAGAGFTGNGKNSTAESLLDWVRSSTDARMSALREAVRAGDDVVREARRRALIAADGSLAKNAKPQILALCVNRFPDAALPWLEAATTLHGEDEVAYSRLLGTGGNFGRQDLCATYLARLRTAFTEKRGTAWLRSLLAGDESVSYLRDAVGQFDPGRAGGIQSAILGADTNGFVNPWAFLLTLEGTLLFASAVSRRQGSGQVVLPFQVRGSTSGYAHAAANEPPLGELWAPEWAERMSLGELRQLLSEGRAQWRGQDAASGLDFVRAVASLGVDRGVGAFQRFLFVDRLGQNPLAVHAERVTVAERPGVRLLAGLDHWRNRVHRQASAAVETAAGRLDTAIHRHAGSGEPADLVELFVELGRTHDTVARSGAMRAKVSPLVLATGRELLPILEKSLDDVDLRIALGLATARDAPETAQRWPTPMPTLRTLLSPVGADRTGGFQWTGNPAPVSSTGDLRDIVLGALRYRAQAAPENDVFSAPDAASGETWVVSGVRGVLAAFTSGLRLTLADLELFGAGTFDQERTALLLSGLLCVNWQYATQPRPGTDESPSDAGLALLSLFALPRPIVLTTADGRRRTVLRANRSWPPLLHAGREDEVLADAAHRLRLAGFRHVVVPHTTADPAALAASLLLPPRTAHVESVLTQLTDGTESIAYERPVPTTTPTGRVPVENSEEISA